MRFLDPATIATWCESNGIALDASGLPLPDARLDHAASAVFADGGRSGRELAVAAAAISALGAFDACLLWVVEWGVWPSGEDWPAFYAARGIHGERQSLDRTPGHLFEADEVGPLLEFLTLVLQNAWDAHVLTVEQGDSRDRLFCSHDGVIELRSLEPADIVWAV